MIEDCGPLRPCALPTYNRHWLAASYHIVPVFSPSIYMGYLWRLHSSHTIGHFNPLGLLCLPLRPLSKQVIPPRFPERASPPPNCEVFAFVAEPRYSYPNIVFQFYGTPRRIEISTG
ncbi:hypothetical protein AVEN_252502-1 [Araneus ventricosus]|uniref:Uncharacterized protein n=1 Tax=Araneus ventricosus TaxID=182803 RepID=A0A4Y2AQY1_ARAVE|nr:hypothetical protein AVEN_252502-1 [Araneus ventricosus]